jgi:hypothetical protein
MATTMAKVDQLIASLAADGEVESKGEFTLDREKAKVKMRQFQLAEPDRYVLLLVQAAILKGAENIVFDIDTDDMRMSFDGEPFSAADVDELYTSLFGGKRDRTIRARRELAMALNAAMGLNPRYVVLESGDGERGIRLELRPEQEDVVEAVDGMAAGTRIHVKDQFRAGLLIRFVRDLRGEILEEKRLREHCKWASVAITLDGELISQRVPLARAIGRVELRGKDATGVAGFEPDGEWRARVQVLNNGVWLAEHELPEFPPGFRAVVDGTELEKDVSQTDVVRNAAYHRLRGALRKAAQASIVQVCEHYARHREAWLGGLLRATLFREAATLARDLGSAAHVDALCDLPLWRNAAHHWVTTRQLLESPGPGFTTKETRPIELPEGKCVVFALRPEERAFFSPLDDGRISDRTSYLARMIRNEKNRQAFRQRRQDARLGSAQYLGRVPVEGHGAHGEVGLVQGGAEKASIRLVLDGCLLCELNPKFPVPGIVAVLEAPLQPRVDYQTACRDEALAGCVRLFGEGLAQVMTQAASQFGDQPLTHELRRLFLAYLMVVTTPGYDTWLFKQLGFGSKSAKRRAKRTDDWQIQPDLRVGGESAHPLARLRLFDSADGRVLSLCDMAEAIARDGKLAWIDRAQPAVNEPPRLVVRVTERQRKVLVDALGEDSLFDCAGEYADWVEREKFLLRPRSELALNQWVHESLAFEVDGLRGVVGLASFTLSIESDTPVVPEPGVSADMVCASLLLEERHLCDHWFTLGVPGVVATATGDLIVPNENYSDLEGDTWVRVGRALGKPVADLMTRIAELHATREMPDAIRHALSFTLKAAFGSPRMVHAYTRLKAHSPETAGAEYARLQELATAFTSDEVGRALRYLLRRDQLPSPDAIEARLRARGLEPGDWYEAEAHVRAALASAIEAVSGVLMFPLAGRGDVAFTTLLELRGEGRIPYVSRALAAQIGYDGDRAIVVVDDVLIHVLDTLFGPRGLEDASKWLEQWHVERQLANRQQLEKLRVPPSAMLAVLELKGEVEGEIGLPRARPMLDTRSFVQLCRDRRPLCTLELAHAVPVSAVLDWSELEVEQGSDGMLTTTTACAGWIASRIEDELDALMDALAAKKLSRMDAEQARIYVLMYLVHRLKSGEGKRTGARAGALARLAALPVFEDVEGELRSLMELEKHYEERGRLSYLTTTPFGRPRDRVVVRARYDELDLWRVLFPELFDYAIEAEQERKLRQRKATLRPLPERPPENALCFRRVDAAGLEGFLWIEGGQGPEAAVGLGGEGLCVGELVIDPIFCCRGAVQGPAVSIDDDWAYFELGDDALSELKERALEMYEQLAADGSSPLEPEAGERRPWGGPGAVRWILRAAAGHGRGPVGVLREAALRMHTHRQWGALSGRELAVYRRLCELPLFSLSTGRFVSLHTAVRERPFELSHLGLWSEDTVLSPEPAVEDADVHAPRHPEPPPPPPPPPPPTPEELLLDAIRAELRVVRTANQNLLSDAHLDLVELGAAGRRAAKRLVEIREERVVVNVAHPVFVRAVEEWGSDRVQVSLLASLVYTGLNVLLEEISDQHEQLFHRVHAAHVLSSVLTEDDEDRVADDGETSD